jgi:hypothetical protein
MLALSKRLVFEYKFVVMKMFEDLPNNLVIATNYELLCDVETMMGLTYVLPMLEIVQKLNKLTQNKKCFICDFVVVAKLTQVDLYNLCVDLEHHFSHDQFQYFMDLVEFKFDTLPIVWYVEPTTQMDYDAFCFKEQFYMLLFFEF